VRELVGAGIIPRRADLDTARLAYIRHLRAMASAHKGDGPLDLVQERAALAAVQRQQIETRLARERDELIPFELVEKMWTAMAGEVKSGLLSQHNVIAAEHPEIPKDVIVRIRELNRGLLTQLAGTRMPAALESIMREIDALIEGDGEPG